MKRLFVAIDLPDHIRDDLSELQGGVPGARWIDWDNLHLTLRFIGDVREDMADDVDMALSGIVAPSFDLSITGLGTFETRGEPTTLWAGIERNPQLKHLRDRIESSLRRIGLPPEGRKFSPHITLARLKNPCLDRLHSYMARNNLVRLAPFTVHGFTLFSSHLGRSGATYTPEACYRLKEPALA
ncbi:MAG: RNA 2',3'-cyclic phosphodiesterase [Alphaproteobacteria bacterium]|nr:RNA 2',3'-cyclic phosphodiesterase [Alphaproteobacteria bacterium]